MPIAQQDEVVTKFFVEYTLWIPHSSTTKVIPAHLDIAGMTDAGVGEFVKTRFATIVAFTPRRDKIVRM